MSINISRNGDQPAQITVKWNDKKWENINEKELDKLPAEVRTYVERMLGHSRVEIAGPIGTISAESLNLTIPAPPPVMPGTQGPQMQVQPFRSLEDRLDELNRKIDHLQQELNRRHETGNLQGKAEKNNQEVEPLGINAEK